MGLRRSWATHPCHSPGALEPVRVASALRVLLSRGPRYASLKRRWVKYAGNPALQRRWRGGQNFIHMHQGPAYLKVVQRQMVPIDDTTTMQAVLAEATRRFADRPLLVVPANDQREWHPDGYQISFAGAAQEVDRLSLAYRQSGFGHGHRIALLLENRPEHLLHKLALNALGSCCIPINPDYRSAEIGYLLSHSKPDLAVISTSRTGQFGEGLARSAWRPEVVTLEDFGPGLPAPLRPPVAAPVTSAAAASILYTSGTTGRPKGCVLSQGYELASGAWYASRGGLASFNEGDRIFNPLPLYHVNSSVLSFTCALLTGNCQIQSDRFRAQRWWREIAVTGATVVHYLGVIVPMLLGQAPDPDERRHQVRFGIGAGVEPQLHSRFEQRFGFPLIEIWGMTEMVRILIDNEPPRHVGTRAFGRAQPGIQARIVDEADRDVPDGTAGEFLIRHSRASPRRHFFSGYLDDEAATEAAWRGGWFHTGDVVKRDGDGVFYLVDRRKNIIRRSGENIAAAEIEALLQAHPWVKQVAVMAVPDELREEEVLACVVPASDTDRATLARVLFAYCYENLAYFKAPGWVYVLDELPTTGTQKIQKHLIFPSGTDPRTHSEIVDFRPLKKRSRGCQQLQGEDPSLG